MNKEELDFNREVQLLIDRINQETEAVGQMETGKWAHALLCLGVTVACGGLQGNMIDVDEVVERCKYVGKRAYNEGAITFEK